MSHLFTGQVVVQDAPDATDDFATTGWVVVLVGVRRFNKLCAASRLGIDQRVDPVQDDIEENALVDLALGGKILWNVRGNQLAKVTITWLVVGALASTTDHVE